MPQFAHLPMILGADKTRLSKRHGATSVTAYRDMGFLPEAMVNYLVRLGWSHGDQEIFTLEELVEHFGFDHVGDTAGVFNPEKMLWVNQTWIKTLSPQELARRALPHYRAAGLEVGDDARLVGVARVFQERAKTLVELVAQSRCFFAPVELDPKAKEKFLGPDGLSVLQGIREGIAGNGDARSGKPREALPRRGGGAVARARQGRTARAGGADRRDGLPGHLRRGHVARAGRVAEEARRGVPGLGALGRVAARV